MGRIERAMIAIVAAFVVGLVGTMQVGSQVTASRSDTVGFTVLAIVGIGALCAVIGSAAHTRPEALLAGSVGLIVAVAQLLSGNTAPLASVLLLTIVATIVALPYLAGFGLVTLVAYLLAGEPRRTP